MAKAAKPKVEVPAVRTSTIRKSIKRTISTGQFETLVIEDGIEETINWSDLKERSTKIDNWNTLLLQSFKTSHDRILSDLGLAEKKAFFKNPTPQTIDKYKHLAENVVTNDSPAKKELRGLDLDELDTLN